jgi:hypothetical protein
VQASVPGWRPYLDQGHWEYTEQGWNWHSDYPWGEYVFHYGRWTRDPQFGWAWVPGYHWGPGWVCWRNAENAGFCGWAPLPPGARFEVGVGLIWNGRVAVDTDFGLAPDAFVFLPFDHFWAHDYRGFLAPGWRNASYSAEAFWPTIIDSWADTFSLGALAAIELGSSHTTMCLSPTSNSMTRGSPMSATFNTTGRSKSGAGAALLGTMDGTGAKTTAGFEPG